MVGKLASTILSHILLAGSTIPAAAAGTTGNIQALVKDGSGKVLLATGTDVPVDTSTIYAKGCLFIDTDVATGTTGLYCNKGTSSACVFTAVTQG
jgi:hypothetical protein